MWHSLQQRRSDGVSQLGERGRVVALISDQQFKSDRIRFRSGERRQTELAGAEAPVSPFFRESRADRRSTTTTTWKQRRPCSGKWRVVNINGNSKHVSKAPRLTTHSPTQRVDIRSLDSHQPRNLRCRLRWRGTGRPLAHLSLANASRDTQTESGLDRFSEPLSLPRTE